MGYITNKNALKFTIHPFRVTKDPWIFPWTRAYGRCDNPVPYYFRLYKKTIITRTLTKKLFVRKSAGRAENKDN